MSVHNLGPGTATDISVDDLLPGGLTYQDVDPAALCTPTGDRVQCSLATLLPQSVLEVVISATVNADVVPGTSLQNSVWVSSTTTDPNTANNYADADTNVVGRADLVIDKQQVAPAGPVTAGELVTYTITITNTGPGSARAVDVKDELPAGMTVEQISATDGLCGGTVCQFGTLIEGAVRTVTMVARVGSDVTLSSLVNQAAVFSPDDDDPTPANQDTVTTPIQQVADIVVNKIDLIDPVTPGSGLLYEITVRNNGPSDAQSVVVTDTLDVDSTFVSASPGCVSSGVDIVCTVGTLAAGRSRSFLIAANAATTLSAGSQLVNAVVATTSTPDPTPVNTDVATTTVKDAGIEADIAIAKSTGSASVTAGRRITYSLTITNGGPSAATNVRVLELVPDGTTLVAMSVDNPDDGGEYCSLGGSCYLGTVYTDTTALIAVVLEVETAYSGDLLDNSAQVSPMSRTRIRATTSPAQLRRYSRWQTYP